jgi:hypothetical protein
MYKECLSRKSIAACSWDHFESESSVEHGSDLQRLVKKMRMNTIAFVMFTLLPFNFGGHAVA